MLMQRQKMYLTKLSTRFLFITHNFQTICIFHPTIYLKNITMMMVPIREFLTYHIVIPTLHLQAEIIIG